MITSFKTQSTCLSLFVRGKFWDIGRPWKVEIDLNKKHVTIFKRSRYLINVDEQIFKFSSVTHITINNFLFGADVHIRMYSGTASIYCISKKAAKTIKDILLKY